MKSFFKEILKFDINYLKISVSKFYIRSYIMLILDTSE